MKKEKDQRLKFVIPGNKHIDFIIKKNKHSVPRHWHNYFEIEIIVGGKGKETICGESCEIFPGCVYLLSMYDYHSVDTDEEFEIFQMRFDENYLTQEQLEIILNNKTLPFFVLSPENFEIVKKLYLVCKEEYDAFTEKSACLKKMVECFITKITDNIAKNRKGKDGEIPEALKSAILYMHTHFQKPITLSEVADVAKYNASYFSTAFSNELDTTFSEYLAKLRIGYAKQLLASTDEGVSEIGRRSGFSSPSTFLQSFKKYENMSPTAYRKKNN